MCCVGNLWNWNAVGAARMSWFAVPFALTSVQAQSHIVLDVSRIVVIRMNNMSWYLHRILPCAMFLELRMTSSFPCLCLTLKFHVYNRTEPSTSMPNIALLNRTASKHTIKQRNLFSVSVQQVLLAVAQLDTRLYAIQ